MSLKLSLKPGETFIVNGAVIRNGDRRGVLLLENQARILREKDILRPHQVKTLSQEVYFMVMQMYLSGCGSGKYYEHFCRAMTALMEISGKQVRQRALDISQDVTAGELYRALVKCRKLAEVQTARSGKAA